MRDLPLKAIPTGFNLVFRHEADLSLLRPPFSIISRYRNINRFSITYALWLQLRDRLTHG